MNFEFATAGRIVFGPGTLKQTGTIVAELGRRALIVTGSNPARAQPLIDILDANGVEHAIFSVSDEPTVEDALNGVGAARERQAQVVIGFGGGSALDSAKAIAALLTNPGDPFEYLEVIGRGKPLQQPSAPVIAIPTTAGTGSEVTRNAVLASAEHGVKVSMRSPSMLPRVAIVDPLLTHSVPPNVTAFTGMDALTQTLEPLVSSRANPLADGVAWEGLRRAVRSLRHAYEDGNNAVAREDMAFASLCGGIALANAGLGAVHGFAGPFGGMFHAPHGAICAALLAPVMAANLKALRLRVPQHPALSRYQEIAQLMTGRPDATADDGVAWVSELSKALQIAPLTSFRFAQTDYPALISKAQAASSMKANPIQLTDEELHEVLEQAG